jgi:3-phenylpropionate/trans-cinnamate dioxygenase ferredoxin component
MPNFVAVAQVSDLPEQGKLLVEIGERMVVLLNVGGKYYCIDDVCTHDGGPLADGVLCEFTLACPRHGAKFDIRTGQALTMPATENSVAHEVKVENETIYIALREE